MITRFCFGGCLALIISCSTGKQGGLATNPGKQTFKDSNFQKQREVLKGYALCGCIQEAYKDNRELSADVSASFYHDLLLYPQDKINYIDSVARSVARGIHASNYPDYRGKKAVLFFCTEFYNSKTLDSIIRSMDSTLKGDADAFFR